MERTVEDDVCHFQSNRDDICNSDHIHLYTVYRMTAFCTHISIVFAGAVKEY